MAWCPFQKKKHLINTCPISCAVKILVNLIFRKKKKNRRPTELNSPATRCSFLFGPVSCAARNGDFSCSANTLACRLCACACACVGVWRMPRELRKSFQSHRQMKILEPNISRSEKECREYLHTRSHSHRVQELLQPSDKAKQECAPPAPPLRGLARPLCGPTSPWSYLGATSLALGSYLQQLTPPGSDRLTENAS